MTPLIAFWVRNPVAANLLMVLILLVGTVALLGIDKEELPSVEADLVEVSVRWPGASPRDVEETIILPLEAALADLEGVSSLEAVAEAERGRLQVGLARSRGRPADLFDEIERRVSSVPTLPRDADPPHVALVERPRPVSLLALVSDMDPLAHQALARQVRTEIAALPGGTPLVRLKGVRQQEVSVDVSAAALRRYDLSLAQVAAAVRSVFPMRSAGSVRTATGDVPLAADAPLSADGLADVTIVSLPDGGRVALDDVAAVRRGFAEGLHRYEVDGTPAIGIQPLVPDGGDIVAISEAINRFAARRNETLPAGTRLRVIYDSATDFEDQLSLVGRNALGGLALVLVVLSLFLRPAIAFWVAVGIAVSFVGTFAFMPAAGVSLSFLSLFGLLLVIGIVVDDALVIGEAVHRENEAGVVGPEAAIRGAAGVARPVIFSVVTTMIAFAPFLFVTDPVAQLGRHIALTILFALAFSLVESFFILPAHLAHLRVPGQDRGARRRAAVSRRLDVLAERAYRPLIRRLLRARYATIAAFVVLSMVAGALLQHGYVPFRFDPDVEERNFHVRVDLQPGSGDARKARVYDEMRRVLTTVRSDVGEDVFVATVTTIEGDRIEARVVLVENTRRTVRTGEVMDRIRARLGDIPDAQSIRIGGEALGGESRALVLTLTGGEIDELVAAAGSLSEFLGTFPILANVRDDARAPGDELTLALRPTTAGTGLSLADVTQQVRLAFYGREIVRLPQGEEDVPLMVRLSPTDRNELYDLDRLDIVTANGGRVPLSGIAVQEFGPALRQIRRLDGERSVSVTASIPAGTSAAPVYAALRDEFRPALAQAHPTVRLLERGARQSEASFYAELKVYYAVALFAMYALLAVAFGSYWQPLLLMSAIPLGVVGAVFGHFACGVPFAMFSAFGVGAVAGIVINDNLILIDRVNQLRREGEDVVGALTEAGVARFRPIFLTSLTTFVGLLPILFERSENAQFLKPVIVSLAFGVLFAFFVTLLFVPACYAIGGDVARFFRWAWTGDGRSRRDPGRDPGRDGRRAAPTDGPA